MVRVADELAQVHVDVPDPAGVRFQLGQVRFAAARGKDHGYYSVCLKMLESDKRRFNDLAHFPFLNKRDFSR